MATITVTKDNFNELVSQHDFLVLDFWAAWCGPCVRFAPTFEAASGAEANDGIVFGKIDTEAEQELAASFQIQSIPTLMIIRDKAIVHSEPGALSPSQFDLLLQKARELDMDKLRAQAEESA
ncbi:thioredoxin family protein [Longispora urticae]